jgi:hypothetical protein
MDTGSLLLEPCDGLTRAVEDACGEDTTVTPVMKLKLAPRCLPRKA